MSKPLRLVDFVMALLEAHALTLLRLVVYFGEPKLIELLESVPDDDAASAGVGDFALLPGVDDALTPPPPMGPQLKHPFTEIEGHVGELGVSSLLEFYLWAYPGYRMWAESALDLGAQLVPSNPKLLEAMIDQAVRQNRTWLGRLPIPSDLFASVERSAQVPWVRFRTDILRRSGGRHLA